MEDFFGQLQTAFVREAKRNPGSLICSQAFREFMAPVAKPAVLTAIAVEATLPKATVMPEIPVVSNSLNELKNQVDNCQLCRLCLTRTNPVFGEGNPDAELMFIGEGPGVDEDLTGRPFVGKAGQLLDKMIEAMKFSRNEVYICNIVKCRPPRNRLPEPDEAEKCINYLKKQIELIQPKVIVLLGATAVKFLLRAQGGITRLRGTWQNYSGIPVMPTFHPAFLLRQPQSKREAWSDLKQVMARFNKFPTA